MPEEYVDLGARFAAEGKDSLNAKVNTFWAGALAGFYIHGDYDAEIFLTHGLCYEDIWLGTHSLKFPTNNQSALAHDWGSWLANVVAQALEHKCPEVAGG